MKGKRLAAVLLTVGVAASFVSVTALTACNKKTAPSKATQLVNKTPETQAKVIYVGTQTAADADGSTPEKAYDFYDFFENIVGSYYDTSDILTPGTIVKITEGEHFVDKPVRILVSGTYDDYIIIEAANPDAKTVLNFKSMKFHDKNRGVEIYGNYIYWKGVDICGAGDNGLYIGGSYNVVENCQFYNNRDTGLQLGRKYSGDTNIKQWPSYNLIKNCTSFNNYDNDTHGENADGFAAKLTVGYGNIFDGCIAYRNSDDGWDLYGKSDTGTIGRVIIYNSVAFENGFLQWTQEEFNTWLGVAGTEDNTQSYLTRDGDGNGFKLGGSTLAGDVYVYNCLSFNNRMHGVTDNSNPGNISVNGVTAFNNGAVLDNIKYKDIHDKDGNTTYLYTTQATDDEANKPVTKTYYNSDQDGYIVDGSNNKLILDENGIWRKEHYVDLDIDGEGDEGWILAAKYDEEKDSEKEYFGGEANKIRGRFVKIDEAASTLNTNFGKVDLNATVESSDDRCNNIDIERTDISYNSFSNILSTASAGNSFTGSDRYRGSGYDSLMYEYSGKWSEFTTAKDADYLNGKRGTAKSQAAIADIFVELPANDLGFSDTVHADCRNDDGSINFGNILKIKDYSILLGKDKKIGCDLSKTKWSDYTHYDYTYMTDRNYVKNDQQSILRAAESLLYVQTDVNSCYQNFELICLMLDCNVEWKSSNEKILKIGEPDYVGVSSNFIAEVDVTRPAKDTVVKLTAKITSPDETQSITKVFNINVKAITYGIGELEVDGLKDGNVILSQFDPNGEPSFILHNADDYSGKLVPESEYEVSTNYYFADSKDGTASKVDKFRTNIAGIYTIEKTIKIGSQEKTFTYNVYIVSDDATLIFMGEPTLSMRHDGFNISGELSNVYGSMYVLATEAGGAAPSKETVKANGEKVAISWDVISEDFKHSNDTAYDVYFVLCNGAGDITSDLHKVSVAISEISSESAFKSLVSTGGSSSVIYQLTKDLDFSGAGWTGTKASAGVGFAGLFDGRGHTISGITSRQGNNADKGQAAIFPLLAGGAIMNVNFNEITLEGKEDVGIIGQTQGGYVYNVNITNVNITGVQRIGALIGHVYEQINSPLIIDRVSVVNTSPDYTIAGSTSRAGGIIGFVQTNNGAKNAVIEIEISNCYVNAFIGSETSQENGGIVATYDTDYNNLNAIISMSVRNCYFAGTVKSFSRGGGIVGYHKGLQTLIVFGCVSLGTLYHAGESTPVEFAQKNCSGIMGGYSSAGDERISWCYSNITEHNSNFDVTLVEGDELTLRTAWNRDMEFDMVNVWEFIEEDGNIVAPYIRLRTVTFD